MPENTSTNVAFTPYEISLCLFDVQRTRMWKEAIQNVVKPGDIVIDAGSGTGILGVFAALAGAERVYCIELHPRFTQIIEHMAEQNDVTDQIVVMEGDASVLEVPEMADVVVCELLCTGQFFEPQVQVVQHLRQFMKPNATLVPRKVRSFIRLLDAQEMLYGVRTDVDSRSLVLDDDEPVSTRVCYDEIFFGPDQPLLVDTSVVVEARHTRIADAVLIEGQAELDDHVTTWPTKFLYNPEVIFLKEPMKLERGEKYRIHIRYPYGGDTLEAEFSVEKV